MDKKGILASLRLLLSTQNSLDEAPGVKCSELAVCTDTCHSENDPDMLIHVSKPLLALSFCVLRGTCIRQKPTSTGPTFKHAQLSGDGKQDRVCAMAQGWGPAVPTAGSNTYSCQPQQPTRTSW